MITPLKKLFSIILKSPSPLSQLRIPTGRRQTRHQHEIDNHKDIVINKGIDMELEMDIETAIDIHRETNNRHRFYNQQSHND